MVTKKYLNIIFVKKPLSLTFAYDKLSRITSTADALGNITSYKYDTCGDVTVGEDMGTVLLS
ncbi:RHS repeat protein [Pelotomaculum terephthalicicum JT]|uniref:RHS repeat domain-containing protein n=1 Tax=Pelotomaculum terephthalicicum TaxID=206393 RepID=UPI001F03334B|nr:RHS repeat domain-containing protein [Pelotomaculum terephthalicicum]MCG9969969.1 RHS repeat protein [Pelotomaculum terephthalicicum JT]